MTITVATETEMKVILTMDKKTAHYLKAMMQNDMSGGQESAEDMEKRSAIFHSLPDFDQLI